MRSARRRLPAVGAFVASLVLAYSADHSPAYCRDQRMFEAACPDGQPVRIVSALAEPHVTYPLPAPAGISGARKRAWRPEVAPYMVAAGWLLTVGWLHPTDRAGESA